MRVKIDVRDNSLVDWLVHEVGVNNFKFHITSEEVEFSNEQDLLAFRLKFQDAGLSGYFYAPYIPDFDYKIKYNDKKS